MTDKKKYKYWLAVVDGQTVQFSDLAHMMATALHPDGGMDYAAARINLDDELKLAVRDGLLRVRNPAGLGFHTFPHGEALQRAVLIPDTDLGPFLNARGIELRITPHGNGPDYWTLENAAAAMQEQLNWHDGTRSEFQDQLQAAAQSGAIVLLNPRTCLPYQPERVRTYWEYVTPDSVNTWLATLKAPYRWNPAPPLVKVPHKSPRDFKPWETLPAYFEVIEGVFMYQQAAREIADAEGWNDGKLQALLDEMASAVNDGSLPERSRKTGMLIPANASDSLWLVTVDDVNAWLEKRGAPYRWSVAAPVKTSEPPPVLPASAFDSVEPAKAEPRWSLKTSIKRAPGYRWPLYQVLKAAHIAGQPCPSPRDVLDIWKLTPPPDVQVMPDGVKYNDGLGNPKEADLKAIQQAIKNLLKQ